jgi:hypothetical protein
LFVKVSDQSEIPKSEIMTSSKRTTVHCQPSGSMNFGEHVQNRNDRNELLAIVVHAGIYSVGFYTVLMGSIRLGSRGFIFAKQMVMKKWKK